MEFFHCNKYNWIMRAKLHSSKEEQLRLLIKARKYYLSFKFVGKINEKVGIKIATLLEVRKCLFIFFLLSILFFLEGSILLQ